MARPGDVVVGGGAIGCAVAWHRARQPRRFAIAGLPIAGCRAPFRPGSLDSLPVPGPDPAVSGVWYATGHFRNGMLLAPVTADVLAAAIAGDSPPADIEAFRPDRFEDEA